jgi:hypothetical protein
MSKEIYNMSKGALQIGYPYTLMNYAKYGVKAELVGKGTLDDSISIYKLKLTGKTNKEIDFYFDANTYYLLMVVQQHVSVNLLDSINVTTAYSDYRKTNIGYLIPFTTTTYASYLPDSKTIETITKVIVNPNIDPKIFEKPM